MARAATEPFRIDVDLGHAHSEAERIRGWLAALRVRHDLARFEYTRLVRVVPASPTYSHPILTLGTRFADTEDHLLATYLHEQMHWYLFRLGGPDRDPVTPLFDELVRRYPKAPTRLPAGPSRIATNRHICDDRHMSRNSLPTAGNEVYCIPVAAWCR